MGTSKLSGRPDWEVTCDGLASHPGGVTILLVGHAMETGISSSSNWATRLIRLNLLHMLARAGTDKGGKALHVFLIIN